MVSVISPPTVTLVHAGNGSIVAVYTPSPASMSQSLLTAVESGEAVVVVELEAGITASKWFRVELVAGKDVEIQEPGREPGVRQRVGERVAVLPADRLVGVTDLDHRLVTLIVDVEVGGRVR